MTGAWNPEKVAAFREAFHAFLDQVTINSKERGSGFVLGKGLYLAQRRVLDTLWNGLGQDIHDFKILKGRQAGISTLTRAVGVFWLGFHPGMNGAMVFDSDSHTSEARQEIEDMIDNLPPRLGFPAITARNRYGLRLANQSRLRFMSAGTRESKSGGVLGRSSGLNYLHASEICSWINAEGVVALKNALATEYPDRLYVWESTARGPNKWKELWEDAKEDDLNQAVEFIGWWANDTLRIAQGSERFQRYGVEPPNKEEADRIVAVQSVYGYTVTQEQLAWYRYYTDPSRELEEDDPKDAYLLQDQPWTEEEAWQLSGSTFFDGRQLMRQRERSITFKPESYKWIPGNEFLECTLQRAYAVRDIDLKIWEQPVPNGFYVVAADPAYGHSARSNHSAVEVLRCYADCIEQVAEFASTSTLTHQLAWFILAIESWYAMISGKPCWRIVEINGPGEAVWRELDSLTKIIRNGYLAARAKEAGIADISINARNYIYTRSDSMTAGHNYHFKTSEQLKVAYMERLRDFVHHDGILIRSPSVLDEMTGVTRDGDSIGAEGDARDDRTVALALGIRMWEERVRRQLVGQGLTREADTIRRAASNPRERMALYQQSMFQNMLAQRARSAMISARQQRAAMMRQAMRMRRR